MSICIPTYLVTIDWQACATAFTGVLAVGAAIYVGQKQIEIQRRQTMLAENSIKVALLDRRITCWETIRVAIADLSGGGVENFNDHRKLYEAIKVAEFLFPDEVVKPIRDVSDNVYKAENANRLVDAAARRGDEPARQKALDRLFEIQHSIWDSLPGLADRLIAVSRIDLGDAKWR